jgi:hypothetical protein
MGLIDSLQSALVFPVAPGDAPLQSPQPLLFALDCCDQRERGLCVPRRAPSLSCSGLLAMCGASLLTSKYFKVDILFAPMASAPRVQPLVQLYRLWLIDSVLTDHLAETAARTDTLEASEAQARLMSGLKLLQTILPLEESIVCQQSENGQLVPCARLRSGTSGSLDPNRNALWRKLIQVCDRAVETGEIARVRAGEIDALESVAIPLRHEQRTVGALLLRLREDFDQSDRGLLAAVGGQLARNLQREDARKKKLEGHLQAFISERSSGQWLQAVFHRRGLD